MNRETVIEYCGNLLGLFLTSYTTMLILGADGVNFSYWKVLGIFYILESATLVVKSTKPNRK